MTSQPIIIPPPAERREPHTFAVGGNGPTLVVTEVDGRGWGHAEVAPLHVHHADDEAWYVIDGTLRFRFAEWTYVAHSGATVFAPAGVAHTFGGGARYLLIVTKRLDDLITELHNSDRSEHPATFKKYDSEILE